MKEKILAFIETLILYDYLLFSATFFLFILFITLALAYRHKTILSLLLIFLGFSTLIAGASVGYIQLHKYLFKNSTKILSQKQLKFSEAVVIYGSLTNESHRDFRECKITASAYVVTKNKYRNYLKKFKPFSKISIFEKNIAVSETRKFKIIVEPFRYKGDYNISLGANCR